MQKRALGRTGLEIAPLVLGGNVFGWTADEKASFAVLDAFVDHGFNAIDTADSYSTWVPGNKGGESETIIGNWLKANPSRRDKVTIFTKVGSDMGGAGQKGLSARWITEEVEQSLRRLQTDRIDLYFSHWPDPETPYEETLGAYQRLVEVGKVRAVGASNLAADQLSAALKVSEQKALPRYDVLQPEYNLYSRAQFEGPLRDLCMREELGVVTYFSLASGFLSGKYRTEADLKKSARGGGVGKYLNARGLKILAALDQAAENQKAELAEIALAWIMAQSGINAPIASATSVAQVESFARAASLSLSQEELAALDQASA
jgi:aryl-alcohol dehydrogenase-like predicted oxidoreductase